MPQEQSIRLASRMEQLPPYLFGTINAMKTEKRSRGDDVVDLGMGNPVEAPPERVVEKLGETLSDPKIHRYPAADGLRNLRLEIARSYERDYGVDLDSESEIICTIGSKEGISHLCLALVGPGDLVMVPAPAFPIHIYAAVIAGGEVIRIPVGTDANFLEHVAAMCETLLPKPKVLILNYPHNPTGQTVSPEFFPELVSLAKKHGLIVVHDFAYAKITYDGYKAPSFLQAPGARDVGVEFGTFSKSYNMAGWRLGYCAGNPEIIRALGKIKGYYDYGIFSPIQVAGIIALRECEAHVAEQVLRYQRRRDVLCEGLARMGWDVAAPRGGMFVWAKIPEPYSRMGSMRFAMTMMDAANVALAPGVGFGSEGEGSLRMALVENEQRIRQALRQMRRAMAGMDVKACEIY